MRVLKYLIFLLLILAIGLAIYVAVQPDDYKIIKTRVIKAPLPLIRSHIDDYTKWAQWGVWNLNDPSMQITYGDRFKGDSASCRWNSKIYGSGSVLTTYYSKDSISQEIHYDSPQKETARRFWAFNPTANGEGIIVTAGVEGSFSFTDKFLAIIKRSREQNYERDYSKELHNLDSVIDQNMKRYTIDILGPTEYGGGFYLYQTVSSKFNELTTTTDHIFTEVSAFMEHNNIAASKNPFIRFIEWDTNERTAIVSAAIPVNDRIVTPKGSSVLCGYIPPGRYFKTKLYGAHSNSKEAWAKAMEGLEKQGYTIDPDRDELEIYIKCPENYPNPADLETDIYIPILNTSKEHTTTSIL
ncbi:GyrI-like domain-containing protein [Galbibacter sp.]|uniref:GyrI-like domain-containing protein n=1 Tax=Galbibacter sp. TaxID=2918471 RepID=UPI003A8D4EB1